MRNGKKVVSLLLAGVLAVLSCSCGNSSKEESSKEEADSNPRTEMRDDMTTSQIVEEMGLGINGLRHLHGKIYPYLGAGDRPVCRLRRPFDSGVYERRRLF
ncbi:MAG: hypothetical protein ACLRMM_01485 [Ruminococcus callidus]|uniref:hypothetical protein n=2 Tax=Ruminococcus callidus TaxID=40519 RepID=UPI0039A1E325